MLSLTFVTNSLIHLLMPAMYQIWDQALSHFCLSHGAYILGSGNSIHKQHMHYISQLYSILEGLKWSGMGKGKITAGLGWSEVQRLPYSPIGQESAYNAGDPSSIPGSGRAPGEGIGFPLQYSWVSLVAQLVKNLRAMWETWVQSLG